MQFVRKPESQQRLRSDAEIVGGEVSQVMLHLPANNNIQKRPECLLLAVISTGRRNTLSWKEKMECTARDQRFRRGFTAAEKAEL
jgi:hypothetical protein